MTTHTGCKLVLKDVRHVPNICLNLMSATKLDGAGLVYCQKKWWRMEAYKWELDSFQRSKGTFHVFYARNVTQIILYVTTQIWSYGVGGLGTLARKDCRFLLEKNSSLT